MAKVTIVREHRFEFLQARRLAKSWMVDSEKNYDLECEYIEGEAQDSIEFSRKGLNGVLTVTSTQYELDLTLGFLFSAYKNKIIEQISSNMNKQLI